MKSIQKQPFPCISWTLLQSFLCYAKTFISICQMPSVCSTLLLSCFVMFVWLAIHGHMNIFIFKWIKERNQLSSDSLGLKGKMHCNRLCKKMWLDPEIETNTFQSMPITESFTLLLSVGVCQLWEREQDRQYLLVSRSGCAIICITS